MAMARVDAGSRAARVLRVAGAARLETAIRRSAAAAAARCPAFSDDVANDFTDDVSDEVDDGLERHCRHGIPLGGGHSLFGFG